METANQTDMHLFIFIMGLVFTFIDQSTCHLHSYTFKQQTYPEIKLWYYDSYKTGDLDEPEDRQKLCLYSKMEANLAYIDYNFDRSWHPWEDRNTVNGSGINCGTLPSMYILSYVMSHELKISYVQSSIEQYNFNKKINKADSAIPGNPSDSYGNDYGSDFVNMDEENRRNVCGAARQYISTPLYFLNRDVPKVRPYHFEYLGKKTDYYFTISCPTLPQLFIRRRIGDELDMVLLPSFIDNYEFELENRNLLSIRPVATSSQPALKVENSFAPLKPQYRKDLCNIARRYYAVWLSPFVEDIDVSEASLYYFQYSFDEEELVGFALFCSELPSMYLRQVDSNQGRTKIKITFAPSPADRYIYKVELVGSVESLEDDEEERERRKFEKHIFASLRIDESWNFCFSAQKYLLNERRRWIFKFATEEQILAEHWLILIPKYVRLPEVKTIGYGYGGSSADENDLVIQCSKWPFMYLRRGESDDVIQILFIKSEIQE